VRRKRQPAPPGAVIAILVLTCVGMLAAIYWVVRTGKL
jgi:hypothetical protein